MAELIGTLLTQEVLRAPEQTVDIGAAALKGSLAPENNGTPDGDGVSYETIINRDSGTTYSLIGRVKKPDGRVTLQFRARNGSDETVTVPESRLNEALATEGGAWSSVNRVE
jgi:hypothetical protein